jgi:hypothetical protein
MPVRTKICYLAVLPFLFLVPAAARGQQGLEIPRGAKVYVAPMDGFETYLKEAISKKNVPVEVVDDKAQAGFMISGNAGSQKAGMAKKLIFGSWHSNEEASITVTNLKTGEVVYAYAVHKENSAHGKRSSAEACAKHLKKIIESK